ncbi:MAG: hypothetical protein IPJ82_24305 [Lewinellaceae bacterium]|nr:hypothetical protein [Lewinellaceae bacterium]
MSPIHQSPLSGLKFDFAQQVLLLQDISTIRIPASRCVYYDTRCAQNTTPQVA